MSLLSKLNPAPVWTFFEEICKIPRLSKNESSIRKYLLDFASSHGLEAKEDIAGNILITRPSTPGYESRKTIVLQSHMDMVGEKNADHPHDWVNDPIIPVTDGQWVAAMGTTLGADDGIGIAAQLAILTDKELKAGKIECLFTVDEESGMTGAMNLQTGFFEGSTLLNLDSEDEGILYIGCAGGMDTVGKIHYKAIPVGDNSTGMEISITGLRGGHSGDEIHKGYGNAVKIMNRILADLVRKYKVSLSTFNGGNLRNAIPREAFAVIAIPDTLKKEIIREVEHYQSILAREFEATEKNLAVTIIETGKPGFIIGGDMQSMLIEAIDCCPHGVIEWSKDMEDLVETSTNLASISFTGNDLITIVTTQRSSDGSSKRRAASAVRACLEKAGAEVVHSDGYPGWTPNLQSEILKITKASYNKLFGKEPEVKAIHAGLECGLIHEKFRGIDMISFGPTIRGAHTPEEKLEITTVQMFWDLLTDVLRSV
ncbi:MAG: aminoacyl-histidine dipeptidase [Bacteroidales bacterium]|nr:aminoacyl-histidine dipeptidase [Bacteroidales bacterium]